MKKITSFKTAFLAIIFMAAFTNLSATNTYATIGALRVAIDSLNLPKTGTANTTTIPFTLTGEVVISSASTNSSSHKTTYFVQDATGGILVFADPLIATTIYKLHEGVTGFSGKIQNYNGAYELIPTQDAGAATHSGLTPFPGTEVTIDNLSNYAGQLVTIKNAAISDIVAGTGKFVAGKTYTITTGTLTAVIYASYYDADYITTSMTIPTTNQDITGLITMYGAIPELIPRFASDFTSSAAAGFSSPKADLLSVSLAGKTLSVNNVTNGSTVEIYSTIGAKVQSAQLENGTIQLNNLSKGLYIIRVGNLSSKIMM